MTIKADRTINVQVTINVPVDEVSIEEQDDYSKFLHDRKLEAKLSQQIASALQDSLDDTVGGTVLKTNGRLDVQVQSAYEEEWQMMLDLEEALYKSRMNKVDEIGERLDIKECIWSFSARQFGLTDDYQQQLIDNVQLCEGKVQFVYEGGWDDTDTIECPTIFTNPTMEDVFTAADFCLRMSNDKHHVFVEGVADKGVDTNGVRTLAFYYGS